MEFGALQCVPQNPDCTHCPFLDQCAGSATGNPNQFPVKRHKTKTRERYFNYFHIIYNNDTYLHRRAGKDIWEGLFELPLIETDRPMDFNELGKTPAFKKLFQETGELVWAVGENGVKHVLSHQILHASFYKVEIQHENAALEKYLKVPLAMLGDFPISKLIYNYLYRSAD
jgi:A/G-specific adenine glycosylase